MPKESRFVKILKEAVAENERRKALCTITTQLNNLPKDKYFNNQEVAYWMGQEAVAFMMWLIDNPQPQHPVPIAYLKFLTETKKREVAHG